MKVNVLFDGPPGHKPGRFIDVENAATGAGVRVGTWKKHTEIVSERSPDVESMSDNNWWALQIDVEDPDSGINGGAPLHSQVMYAVAQCIADRHDRNVDDVVAKLAEFAKRWPAISLYEQCIGPAVDLVDDLLFRDEPS